MRTLFLYITLPFVGAIYGIYMVIAKLLKKPYFKYCDWFDICENLRVFTIQWLEE